MPRGWCGGSPLARPDAPLAADAPARARRGHHPDLRRTVRASLRYAGEPLERHWREPPIKPRPVVLVCDVSGSMEPYARMLLQYMQAWVAARRRVEAFVFGTRLTRVTRELGGRDPDAARGARGGRGVGLVGRHAHRRLAGGAQPRARAPDRARRRWRSSSLTAGTAATPTSSADEMARLARCSHSLIWLNPLKAHEGYEPLTRGMRAALPHVDHFLAGNSIASLEELAVADGRRTRMKDVIKDVDAWVARGDSVALATVIDVKRSAPRPPGAKMAVNSRGEVSGAVSGGCVEGAVVTVAEDVLQGGEPRLLHFGIADSEAWDVGLPCGGEIGVFVERYEP